MTDEEFAQRVSEGLGTYVRLRAQRAWNAHAQALLSCIHALQQANAARDRGAPLTRDVYAAYMRQPLALGVRHVTLRRVLDYLHELEEEGRIRSLVEYRGRYGIRVRWLIPPTATLGG